MLKINLGAEHRIFDFDHVMVGEWIARVWKLPLHVMASIKPHHQEPEEREGLSISSDIAIDFTRLADIAVRIGGFGKCGDGTKYKPALEQSLFKRLPIFEKDLLNLMNGLKDDIKRSSTLLNIAAD